jgi:hypothetical protein
MPANLHGSAVDALHGGAEVQLVCGFIDGSCQAHASQKGDITVHIHMTFLLQHLFHRKCFLKAVVQSKLQV